MRPPLATPATRDVAEQFLAALVATSNSSPATPTPVNALTRLATAATALVQLRVSAFDPGPEGTTQLRADLRQIAAPQALVRLCEQRKSGLLTGEAADGERIAVAWAQGQPTHAWSSAPERRLGSFLLRTGRLDERGATAIKRLQAQQPPRPFGWALLQLGLLDQEALWQAQTDLASTLVAQLALWSDGYLTMRMAPSWSLEPTIRLPLPLLLQQAFAGIRTCSPAAIEAALAPLMARRAALAWHLPSPRWEPLIATVPSSMRTHIHQGGAPEPLQRWLAALPNDDARQRQMAHLYTLVQLGLLGFRESPHSLRLGPVDGATEVHAVGTRAAAVAAAQAPSILASQRPRAAAKAKAAPALERAPAILVAVAVLGLMLFGLANMAQLGNGEYFYNGDDLFFYLRRLLLLAAGGLGCWLWWPRANPLAALRALPWRLQPDTVGLIVAYGLTLGFASPLQRISGAAPWVLGLTILHVLAEEVFFRAFLDRMLADLIPDWRLAILLSASLYGVYHLTYASFWFDTGWQPRLYYLGTITAFAGIPYALMYRGARTLSAPLLCHLTVSLTMMLRSLLAR